MGNFTNCVFSTYERYKSYTVDYCEAKNRDFDFVGGC